MSSFSVTITSKDSSQFLPEIQKRWRLNSRTLGFFPEGAFEDYSNQGTILVAVTSDNAVAGYLLFRVSADRITIVHLCVSEEYRGKQIARQLVQHLVSITNSFRGILVTCRRDFEASKVWPLLGFSAIDEKPGRSQDGSVLTLWWRDQGNPDLFSGTRQEGESYKLRVVLDANVFYDLHNELAPDTEESKSLAADWLIPQLDMSLTPETFNEIDRHSDAAERTRRRENAGNYGAVRCDTAKVESLAKELQTLIPKAKSSDRSDIRQLAWTIGSEIQFFVTRDTKLLNLATQLYERYGVSVVRPSDLIVHLDEVREKAAYQPVRLCEALVLSRLTKAPSDDVLVAFARGETKGKFRETICRYLAIPDVYRCYQIKKDEEVPEVIWAYEVSSQEELRIPLFRAKNTQFRSTIQKNLLLRIIKTAADEKRSWVRIPDDCCDDLLRTGLQADGFIKFGKDWMKATLGGIWRSDQLDAELQRVSAQHRQLLEACSSLIGHLASDQQSAVRIERLLWPTRISNSCLPTFIIPIKPQWAKELFDEPLASQDLFGARTTLALNREAVYYRSVRPSGGLTAPARILWYISDDKRHHGSKSIRACSFLDEVVVGKPKELFSRFHRLGIYKWKDTFAVARENLNTRIMAIRFSDTELLSSPVPWGIFQSILRKAGFKSQLQSPLRITPTVFEKIYSHSHGGGC